MYRTDSVTLENKDKDGEKKDAIVEKGQPMHNSEWWEYYSISIINHKLRCRS